MLTRCVSALAVLSSVILAQETGAGHVVRAAGTATISAQPDTAEVSLGVVNQAAKAEAAATENADRSTEAVLALRRELGAKAEISTAGYSISPQYDYKNGAAPRLIGYQATNTVTVRLSDLSLVSKAIDTGVGAGVNNVNNIVFTLRNDEAIRTQAIANATVKARANAEAIAKALGLQVTGVWQAETRDAVPVRAIEAFQGEGGGMAPRAKPMATPIEAGTLDVTATVIVTLTVQ